MLSTFTGDNTCDSGLSYLRIYLINARSLVNKMELFRAYLHEFHPNIVCVTETWANVGLPDAFFLYKAICYIAVTELTVMVVELSYIFLMLYPPE